MKSGKRIAILQSNYIPWKGYFDIINMVDEFVIYDEAQYTRRDWRNRNVIKTKQGLKWLTVPVEVKGRYTQRISETRIAKGNWTEKHFETLRHNYSSAPHFEEYSEFLARIYSDCKQSDFISEVNLLFINSINSILGIKTKITSSAGYDISGNQNEKIIAVCKQAGAGRYITGPAARIYIDSNLFQNSGIELVWVDYTGYPEYEQLHPPFNHNVSILDLIFNKGKAAPEFMKSF